MSFSPNNNDNENNNNNQQESENTSYNYVDDSLDHHRQQQQHSNEHEALYSTSSSPLSNHHHAPSPDLTRQAFNDSQHYTIDKHLSSYKLVYIGVSFLVMVIVVFVLIGLGAKETPLDSECARLFNGTCRGFLTVVDSESWQFFGSQVGCPMSQKCVTKTIPHGMTNCSYIQNLLWARPPRSEAHDSFLLQSCCRDVAGTYLLGFGELILQALLTTSIGMFLNSPFPLMFFRWLREKLACSAFLCCCFCGLAQDDDATDRLDAWYERKEDAQTRKVERSSLIVADRRNNNNDDNDDEDDENKHDENNHNNNTNNHQINLSASSTNDVVALTWIDYLFIPSSLYKYKIAIQCILQAWIAIFYAMDLEGDTSPTEHLSGSRGWFRYNGMVSKTLNGGIFITLIEFLSFVACYHLIELRRTSIDPETHRIESISYFSEKLKSLFVTPLSHDEVAALRGNDRDRGGHEAASTFNTPLYYKITKPGQWLMWVAASSVFITCGPMVFTHLFPCQFFFLPWFFGLFATFAGVFALIFWICDSWLGCFRPISMINNNNNKNHSSSASAFEGKNRTLQIFLSILGRLVVVITINILVLEIYLAPLNAMILTYLFPGYSSGSGYLGVMFDESSMHSSTCSMKIGQRLNFGDVIYAILFYV